MGSLVLPALPRPSGGTEAQAGKEAGLPGAGAQAPALATVGKNTAQKAKVLPTRLSHPARREQPIQHHHEVPKSLVAQAAAGL